MLVSYLTPIFPVLAVYGEVTGRWKFLNRRFVAPSILWSRSSFLRPEGVRVISLVLSYVSQYSCYDRDFTYENAKHT